MSSEQDKKSSFQVLKSYYILTKPSIVRSVLITTIMGFLAATFFMDEPFERSFNVANLLAILVCSFFLCSGICAANQLLEIPYDKKMFRTRNRPLVKEEISIFSAMTFTILLIVVGLFCMYFYFSWKMFLGGFFTCILYLFIYTPMKRLHWFNTTVGSIPGALPPVGGWVAVTEQFNWQGWILFLVIFFWQHPHFYAIARICKNDYKRAGFQMLSIFNDQILMKHVVIHTMLLFASNFLLLIFVKNNKFIFFIFLILLNSWFLWFILKTYFQINKNEIKEEVINKKMKKIVFYSVIYLPLLLGIFALGLFF